MGRKKVTKKEIENMKDVCRLRMRINLGCRNCVYNGRCEALKANLDRGSRQEIKANMEISPVRI